MKPWALILAGGKGERVQKYWQGPKCLLPIQQTFLLELVARQLEGCHVCFNVNSEDLPVIQQSFSIPGEWEILKESDRRGNAAAIRLFFQQYHPDDWVYIQHCDVLPSVTPIELIVNTKQVGWYVFTKNMSEEKSWGVFTTDQDTCPSLATGFTRLRLINTGIYVVHPSVDALFPSKSNIDIDRDVFPELIRQQALFVHTLPGQWIDYGTEQALAELFK